MHHFKSIGEFKLELQSGKAQFGSKSAFFCPLWPWNLMDDLENQYGTVPMLLQTLCIILNPFQTGVTVRKRSIQVNIGNILSRVTLKFNGWPWKKRAPLLYYIKLCASFQSHGWIQTGVTVRKHFCFSKLTHAIKGPHVPFNGKTLQNFTYPMARGSEAGKNATQWSAFLLNFHFSYIEPYTPTRFSHQIWSKSKL